MPTQPNFSDPLPETHLYFYLALWDGLRCVNVVFPGHTERPLINSLSVSDEFRHLLLIFAKNLDPDHARQNVDLIWIQTV